MKYYYNILVAVFMLIFTTSLNAQSIRYVDSTGTDSGNCTDPLNACATINYAMSMAGSGDTIDIASGVYTEQLSISKDLILQGAGDTQPGGTIIQAHASPGQASGRTVYIASGVTVQISNVLIRHGANDDYGGGIRVVSDSNLTLIDVTLRNNSALSFGGGLSNAGTATTTLMNVDFIENTAGSSGGGIVNNNASTLTISGSNFTDNVANTDGGGLFSTGPVSLTDVNFTNNTAGQRGGGIRTSSSITLSGGNFIGNTAEDNGGAVTLLSVGTSSFTDVAFTDNETQDGGQGGAVFIRESEVDFMNSTFTGNKVALNSGGAVYTEESIVSFVNTIFTANEAAQIGGGLYAFDSDITLFNVLFEYNTAEIAGGVALSSGNNNDALIQNTYFKNNEATSTYGGGLINEGGITTLVNTLFTGNLAAEAGGALVSAGELFLYNTTIAQNEATSTGAGGLYNLMGNITMTNSIVWGNIGSQAPNIANANGAIIAGNYSLYDDTDVFNAGTFTCNDCLTIDPEFTDTTAGDFTLSSNSPAIDSGDPATDLSIFPTDGNNSPIDLAGSARVYNNIIDMGAYEFGTLSTGNFDDASIQMTVYPNPTNGILYFETEEEITLITLTSVTGQQLQTWKSQDNINLYTYAKGVYFVKIQTPRGTVIKKIIKE